MASVIPFPQICKDCRAPCSGNFKKVINLKNSGLVIVIHHGPDTEFERKTKREVAILLHNRSGKELKRPQYIGELCQYKTKCIRCVNLIKRVRYLLEEVTDLRENEALSICDHCKNSKESTKCRRCNYILQKFNTDKVLRCHELQQRFNMWISKAKQVLSTFEGNVTCKQEICDNSMRIDELEKLLHDLRYDSPIRKPEITIFPEAPTEYSPKLNDFSTSKKLLEKLLMKLKNENVGHRVSSDDSLYVSPSSSDSACICKYLQDRLLKDGSSLDETNFRFPKKKDLKKEEENEMGKGISEGKQGLEKEVSLEKEISLKKTPLTAQHQDKKKSQLTYKETSATPEEKGLVKGRKTKKAGDKESLTEDDQKRIKLNEQGKVQKSKKFKVDPQTDMILKMLNETKIKDRIGDKKPREQVEIPTIGNLPEITRKPLSTMQQELSFETIVECGQGGKSVARQEMVKGTKIIPLLPLYKDVEEGSKAMVFKTETFLPSLKLSSSTGSIISNRSTTDTKDKKTKSMHESEAIKGVFKYQLSDRQFIDKGWTKLPTTKIMRRMNVYKMTPVNTENDWFERHKKEKYLTYDTGEKLAEIREDGSGSWYYRNGNIALDYYNAEEPHALHRYIVYSSGEQELGPTKPTTVLGLFDYLGNGVVYSDHGYERLKYNQSEGVTIDPKIGPPGKWKWHSLNEPAVFQTVFIDTYVKGSNACLQEIKSEMSAEKKHNAANDEMLSIEFENFVKEKQNKLKQEFKPFQIRMKACKLNDYFSLKVIDQGNIHLLFRNGRVNMKLNLGMILLNNEIVDTDASELGVISTSYDKNPAKSDSVALIQKNLLNVRETFKREAVRSHNLYK